MVDKFDIILIGIYSLFTVLRSNYRRKSRINDSYIIEDRENHIDQIILFGLITTEVITFFLYIFFPMSLSWADIPKAEAIQWIGAVIGISALALFYWVHTTLGQFFSSKLQILQDHKLITTGPYKFVRYPMYTAFMLLHLAVYFLTMNWFIVLTWTIGLTLLIATRIKKEENLLLKKFGTEYEEYKNKTSRFVPLRIIK